MLYRSVNRSGMYVCERYPEILKKREKEIESNREIEIEIDR